MRRLIVAAALIVGAGALVHAPGPALAGPAIPALEQRAAVGDCLSVTDITSVTSAAEAVACTQSHNAEVFRLGIAPDSTGLPSQAFVTAQQLNTMCAASQATTALAEALNHLGIRGATIPTRIYLSVLLPTDEQWKAGARDVQCIVGITTEGSDGLITAQSWTGVASEKTASEGAGWLLVCSPTKPASGANTPAAACTSTGWVQVAPDADVSGDAGSPYPGAALQKAADDACRAPSEAWTAARKRADLQFVAVLPLEEAWKAGVRIAACWIPFGNWGGATTLTPATPIPADAQVTVIGVETTFATSTNSYVVRAANGDDTGLARIDMVVSLTGSAEFAGGGKDRVLTTDDRGDLPVTVIAGKSGTFTITGVIAAKPSVTGSLTVQIDAAPAPAATIMITGKKGMVGKNKGVVISGTSTGLAPGASVTPYFKIQGAKRFTKAPAIKVSATGTFTWKKATTKPITVYVQSGTTKSNQVTIRP